MSVKLSELNAQQDFVKLLLLGQSGVGKTVSLATFPGKKLWLDFDNKISSVKNFYKNTNPKLLEEIEVKQYGKMSIKPAVGSSAKPRMTQFIEDMAPIFKAHDLNQKLPFDTIVVDTITTLTDSFLEDYRYVSQLAIKRPNVDQNSQSDYGLLQTQFKQVTGRLLALNANVIFVGHTELQTDESTGIKTNEVLMPGKLSAKLGIYFEEVYFAKIDANKQRVWQTQADNKTLFCRTQRGLPSEIPANFAEIMKVR